MDKALKQRLVGASVLIALAVVVLPMLLSGRPENASQQSQKIELPPRPEELSFETRRFPVTAPQGENRPVREREAISGSGMPAVANVEPDRGSGKVTSEASPDDAGAPDSEKPERVTTRTGRVETSPQIPAVKDESANKMATSSPEHNNQEQKQTGRYVVQIASLGSAENASRLMSSLQKKGFPVLLDTIDSAVGQLNRVRVGPFESETEAAQVSARIDKELAGVSPRVVDLQPDQSAAVTQPAGSLARWVVQVGSFADASNVERLVSQLREAGMSAYSETVSTSSSSIFRVRIGPFLEREEALRIKQQLSEKFSIDGVVMSAD